MKLPISREPTETERRLLEAALEVFAEKGLHGATTQEIGDRAKVGKSTLHYYFRHKDERRFNAMPDSPYRVFVDNLAAAVERGESRPVDPLQALVTAMGASLFLPIAQASMVATLEELGGDAFELGRFVAERTEYLVDLMVLGLQANSKI